MSTFSFVSKKVLADFRERRRQTPSTEDALLFIQTELAEATELVLAKPNKKYLRNSPKEPFSKARFAEELGDIIYMTIIAGYTENVDPLMAMKNKMEEQK